MGSRRYCCYKFYDEQYPGEYTLTRVQLRDTANVSNSVYYYRDGGVSGDTDTTFHSFDFSAADFMFENPTVIPDVEAPILTDIAIEQTVYEPGDKIFIDYDWTDNASDLERIRFNYTDSYGNSFSIYDWEADGIAAYKFYDEQYPGEYTLTRVQLRDTANVSNSVYYYRDGGVSGDTDTTFHSFDFSAADFTFENPTVIPDVEAPILTDIAIEQTVLSQVIKYLLIMTGRIMLQI